MSRAPFQVLVFPYRVAGSDAILYAVFRRAPSDGGYWQGIAGGGEIGESPLEAARREAFEEAEIKESSDFIRLESLTMIPVVNIVGDFEWGEDVLVVPEYSFGVRVEQEQFKLSKEHADVRWVDYETARRMLHWDSNKNALWELNCRVTRKKEDVRQPVQDFPTGRQEGKQCQPGR